MDTVYIRITGIVQGVGFRFAVKRVADSMGGIGGVVRNEVDGSVSIEANGSKEALDSFVQALRTGSLRAGSIDRMDVTFGVQIEHRKHFSIAGYGFV